MTIGEAFRIYFTYLNKDVNGYFNPQEVEDILNDAQMEKFLSLVTPQPQERVQIGGVGTNTRKTDALLPFQVSTGITLTNGIGTFPADYAYYAAATMRYYVNPEDCGGTSPGDRPGVPKYVPIDQLTPDEWAERINDSIDYPTMENPVFKFRTKTTIEVLPNTIARVEFEYYRNPLKMYWGRNIVNGLFEYNPNDPLIVHPEWFDLDMNDVIKIALRRSSVPLANDRLFQTQQ